MKPSIVFVISLTAIISASAQTLPSLLDALRASGASIFADQIEADPTIAALYLSDQVQTVFAPIDNAYGSNFTRLGRRQSLTPAQQQALLLQCTQGQATIQSMRTLPGGSQIVTQDHSADLKGKGQSVISDARPKNTTNTAKRYVARPLYPPRWIASAPFPPKWTASESYPPTWTTSELYPPNTWTASESYPLTWTTSESYPPNLWTASESYPSTWTASESYPPTWTASEPYPPKPWTASESYPPTWTASEPYPPKPWTASESYPPTWTASKPYPPNPWTARSSYPPNLWTASSSYPPNPWTPSSSYLPVWTPSSSYLPVWTPSSSYLPAWTTSSSYPPTPTPSPPSLVEIFSGLGNSINVIQGDIPYAGGHIQITDGKFTLPASLSATVQATGQSTFASLASSANLTDTLDNIPYSTFFIPSNQAFANANTSSPSAATASLLEGHVVPNFVGYLPSLLNGSTLTTQAGSLVTVTIQGNNYYINGAMIVSSNIILENGVAHVIDKILSPPSQVFTGAASSTIQKGIMGAFTTAVAAALFLAMIF